MEQDSLFWFCALLGTGLFIVQFLLTLLGGAFADDLDDAGLHLDAGKIKWLSKQTLTGFLLLFGWVGLTCKKEGHFSETLSCSLALAAGFFSMLVTGWLFKMAKKLHSPGAVFRLDAAIGKEATVYQRIPSTGTGKISVSLEGMSYEIDAISASCEQIESFTKVQIIKKADETTAVVVPWQGG